VLYKQHHGWGYQLILAEKMPNVTYFTAKRVQKYRGIAIVSRPSACAGLSVTLMYGVYTFM